MRSSLAHAGRLAVPPALAGLVYAVYGGVGDHPFIGLDDNLYVTENPLVLSGLSLSGGIRAFAGPSAANWHPLTILSHMADVSLFGTAPGSHHLVNVLFHAAAVLALFLALRASTGSTWRSAAVAALFAAHPLHVESVAWISSRKDLLCALFWFLAWWAYAGYARKGGAARYGTVLGLYCAALLSKPMAVTFPFTLLLLDAWPLDRSGNTASGEAGSAAVFVRAPTRRLLIEKVPFLLLSAAVSAVTLIVQKGAMPSTEQLSLGQRAANVPVAVASYLSKTFWPSGLAPFYPHPALLPGGIPGWRIAGSVLLLAAVTAAAIRARRSAPCVPFGWFFFAGTLVPVLGLVQVGSQGMADRYAYIPLAGLFVALVWGAHGAVSRQGEAARRGALAAGVVLLGSLVATARVQAGLWKEHRTLFLHTIAVTGPNAFAHSNLGVDLLKRGRPGEALAHFREAVRILPTYGTSWYYFGAAASAAGDKALALDAYRRALALDPRNWEAQNNLGSVLMDLGRREEAEQAIRRAVAGSPSNAKAWYNLGVALSMKSDFAGGAAAFREAVRLAPDEAVGWNNLGNALLALGEGAEAKGAYREALRVDPRYAPAWRNLGFAAARLGDPEGYREALGELRRLSPPLADDLERAASAPFAPAN